MNMQWQSLRYAWKNVWRNRRRSMTTAGITAISVCGLLFFGGFVLYTYQSLEEFSARSQGHVIIAHTDYFEQEEDSPMSLGLDGWQAIRKALQQDDGVRRVLPRIQFSGLISNGEKSTIFIAEGVDAGYEFTVTGPFMQVSKGDVLSPVPGELPQIMLGQGVAKNLKVHPGDIVTLLATTSDGALNGIDVQVVGIFGTGMPELDARKVMVGLDTAQELLNSERISTLSVYLRKTSSTLAYQQTVQQHYPSVATRNWSDLAFFYHKVRDLYSRVFTVVGLVIVIVVMLSVANTMSMAVIERTREIGTLAALGTLPAEMLKNFVLEAMIIGALGSFIGMLLAGLITLYLSMNVVMMPPPPGMTEGYPLAIAFSLPMYASTCLVMIVVTILGGLFAARKGVKRPIVEALAHV